jgi:outer membrane protein
MRRALFCAGLAALAITARAPLARAQAKAGDVVIGYVSIQRAILETEEGKRAKKQLKGTFEEKQKRLTDRETEIMKLKEALEREAAGGKDDPEMRKKVIDFQNKLLELKQIFMKEQQDLAEAEQKQLGDITGKMKKIIEEIGQQGGYTLILEVADSRLLYAKPHLDLTNEVIRKYNAKFK